MNRKDLLQDISLNPVKIIPGRRVVSMTPGEWTSPYIGKGFETRGFRDFELGDDPRAVHLSTSVRRGTPTIVERVALRDLTIMIVLDLSPSILVRNKFNMQMIVAALLLYSAWKSETTFGLAFHDGEYINSFGCSIGTRHFYKLYNKLWQIFSSEGDDRGGVIRHMHLRRSFPQNSIIFYCSDFLDSGGDLIDVMHLWRQSHRYDFIPVVIQDEFEFTFPIMDAGTFIGLNNPETGDRDELWISKSDSKEIRDINESRFQNLIESFNKNNTFSIHINQTDIHETAMNFIKFFEERKRRGAR
ncbi:MAG: DUF58 domain-containing protein [Gammaproteobacteria bacterium]